MRLNFTSGSLFQGFGLIGTGAIVMWPDQKWIGAVMMLAGVLILVFDVHFERGHLETGGGGSFRTRWSAMWPQYFMGVAAILFVIGLVAYLQGVAAPQNTNVMPGPLPTVTVLPAPAPSTQLPAIADGSNKVETTDQRIFVSESITPYSLMALYRDNMTIKADRLFADFIGKWMKLSGPLGDVSSSGDMLLVTFADDPMASLRIIFMRFGKEWLDRLAIIPKTQLITVECRIKNASSTSINFENCRLI